MPKFLKQRGTLDIFDVEAQLYKKVINACEHQASLSSYNPIVVPTFESTALYTRSTGETSDIVTKEMYDFKDKSGRDISLRPEGTAGVIRAVVENKLYAINDLPLRYYYDGSFFRYERPQVGRYREFTQFGVEVVGTNSYLDDIDTIILVRNILKELNIKDYKVRINTFGNVNCRNIHRDNIKSFFAYHIDNLCEDCKNRFNKNPLRILDCKVDKEYIEKLTIPVSIDALDDENKQLFDNVLNILKENDVNFEVDKYLVRGLDYYTGIIYEFDITLSDGKTLTIGGGGRYSSLVKELDGPDLNCVGFGLGVNRLVLVLQDLYGLQHFNEKAKYYIMPFSKDAHNMAVKVAQALKNLNNKVIVETNTKSVGSMFKFASKHGFEYAIMIGDEEIANNNVKVKNLKTQEQYFVSFEDVLGGKIDG